MNNNVVKCKEINYCAGSPLAEANGNDVVSLFIFLSEKKLLSILNKIIACGPLAEANGNDTFINHCRPIYGTDNQ